MSESSTLSETKRRLLQKYLRGEITEHVEDLATITRRLRVRLHRFHWPKNSFGFTIHCCGPLDASALERSLCEVICRHEIWRTS